MLQRQCTQGCTSYAHNMLQHVVYIYIYAGRKSQCHRDINCSICRVQTILIGMPGNSIHRLELYAGAVTAERDSAAGAEITALREQKPQQTGAEKPTRYESAGKKADMPAGADMRLLPETVPTRRDLAMTGETLMTTEIGLEIGTTGLSETEAAGRMREVERASPGTGIHLEIGSTDADQRMTDMAQTDTSLLAEPSVRMGRGAGYQILKIQALLALLRRVQK